MYLKVMEIKQIPDGLGPGLWLPTLSAADAAMTELRRYLENARSENSEAISESIKSDSIPTITAEKARIDILRRFSEYHFQLAGVGQDRIFINAFLDNLDLSIWQAISGGGSKNFHAIFDSVSKTIIELSVNSVR